MAGNDLVGSHGAGKPMSLMPAGRSDSARRTAPVRRIEARQKVQTNRILPEDRLRLMPIEHRHLAAFCARSRSARRFGQRLLASAVSTLRLSSRQA
jgi:hypothetical protein